MCDVRMFLTFTFVIKILQRTHSYWWRWFTQNIPPSSLNLVLRWLLFYLFCSSIVINAAIVTTGTFEPLIKAGGLAPYTLIQPTICLEMSVTSQGHYDFLSFPVVDWFCLFIYLWVLPFPLADCSEFGNFVITLIFNICMNLNCTFF